MKITGQPVRLRSFIFETLFLIGTVTLFFAGQAMEYGAIIVAAVVFFLVLSLAEQARPAKDRLHWYEFQRPLILLVPLLFLMNAQGASLNYYTFNERFTGTAAMSVDVEPSAVRTAPPVTRRKRRPEDMDKRPDDKDEGAGRNCGVINSAARDDDDDDIVDSGEVLKTTTVELYETPHLYEGKRVTLIGMVDTNDDIVRQFGKRAKVLFRFLITCCAADATPVAVVFETRTLTTIQAESQWLRVVGTFTLEKKDGRTIPVIKDATVSTVPKPKNVYLY